MDAQAQAFLEVLQNVLAPRLHEENAFDEGQKVPGAIKTLRLVCKEAAQIIAAHVTRLRVEPDPVMAAALVAAAQRFNTLECLSVEVLSLQRSAWRAWTALTLNMPAAAGTSAAKGAGAAATGASAARGVGAAAARQQQAPQGLRSLFSKLLRLGSWGRRPSPSPSPAARLGGNAAATKNKWDTDPEEQPSLAYLLQALQDPKCLQHLVRLRHMSVQAAPPAMPRAPLEATAALVACVSVLPVLRSLRLLRVTTNPEALAPINGMMALRHLVLYNCDMSQGLGPLTHLTRLDIGMEHKPGIAALPNLSPASNLRELRALGWVLDAHALSQLSCMPHLTCLEAARIADELIRSNQELPAPLPALHRLKFTDMSLQGLQPETIGLVTRWCGASLRTIPDLALCIAATSPHKLASTLEQLSLLGQLLDSCRIPHLSLSKVVTAQRRDTHMPSNSAPVPNCLVTLHAALERCLPTPTQQQRVETLSVIGMDLYVADMQALVNACGWCREVKFRQCRLSPGAWEKLHLLPCPAVEMWSCPAVTHDMAQDLLDRLWAVTDDQGQHQGQEEAGRQQPGALRYLCLRAGTYVWSAYAPEVLKIKGASGAQIEISHC